MYKIEDGVPLPVKREKYPFADMAVGQSVFVVGKLPRSFGGVFGNLRKSRGMEFTCKTEADGVRVWRTA